MTQLTTEQALQLAIQHHRAGQLSRAENIYRQIIAQQPNHAEALHSLGVLNAQAGRLDTAVDLIRRAIALELNYAEAYNNLGIALKERGQLGENIVAFRQAITLRPHYPEAYYNLGIALKDIGRLDEATAAFRHAIAQKPDYPEAHNDLGNALIEKGQLDEAIAACRHAIVLKPSYAEAHYNLGVALQNDGQLDDAIATYREAIALKPNLLQAPCNLGVALRDSGQFDQAIAAFRQAIALKADFAEAHFNLALALLAQGDFSQGWKGYEWRWKCKDYSALGRNFPQPLWDGRALPGATLLLHAEQGFGDAIQFMRYIPMAAQRCGKIIVECQAELLPLIQPLAVGGVVVAQGHALPPFDVHCPLLSLPGVFETTLGNVPRQVPYLSADPAAAEKWRTRLADDKNPIKVGLAWAGSQNYRNDRNRSMAISALGPLADAHGVSFYSLQKRDQAVLAGNPPPGLKLIEWTEDRKDFADTSGLIAHLDLIISVETAVVHLAGAMGKPVWVLLAFVPDWRWLLEREYSPWYPTMRLFRQNKPGDWNDVMCRVRKALTQLAQEGWRSRQW